MLVINELTHIYGQSKLALDSITANFDNGITGIIGQNGSGKTTLLKLLTTIYKPQIGSIKWHNLDISHKPNKYLRQVGYVPQDVPIFDELTTMEYLRYFSAYKGVDYRKSKQRINELISYFSLEPYINIRTSKLSGGTLKRLAICNSLLTDPKVWILDEPMNGLDVSERNNFKRLLASYAKDKIIIVSSHILSDIELLANKVMILNNGKLMISGTTNELITILNDKVWCSKVNELTNIDELKLSALQITPSDGLYLIRYVSESPIFDNAKAEPVNLEDVYLYLTQINGVYSDKNSLF